MVAAAVIGAGVLGAGASLVGSSQQAKANQQAASTNQAAINYQEATAAPYANVGNLAENELWNEFDTPSNPGGTLGAQPSLTSSDIQNMPGYQFTQQQGLLATQNAAAAQGLGVSGNALAAASQYATNLASTNYQQYFTDFWANQNNRYNQLMGMTQTGENAAVGSGTNVATASGNAAQQQAAAGTAQAAGTSGVGTSLGNALLDNALLANQTGSTISPYATGGGIANPAAQGSSGTIY